MIEGNCLTCRSWQPPPVSKRGRGTKPGHCRLDGALSHPGYSCGQFNRSAESLMRSLFSEPEQAWLKANPRDPQTERLRAGFTRLLEAEPAARETEQAAFVAVLTTWRNRNAPLEYNWGA